MDPVNAAESTACADDPDAIRIPAWELVRVMARRQPGPLHADMQLASDLGYDSLRLIELAIAIEQRFGLSPIDLGQAHAAGTVGQLTELIVRLRADQLR